MWYIYLIKSSQCEEVYIGSSSRPICQRLAEHLYQYRVKKGNCSVNRIIEYGEDYLSQELLEEIDTVDRRALLQRERWWIENTPHAVNKYTPHRDRDEALQVYNERAKQKRRMITMPTKCECGFTYYYGKKEIHEQTRRHKAWTKLSM